MGDDKGIDRRTALRAAALTGAAVPFLAACGSSGGDSSSGRSDADGASDPSTSSGSSDSGGSTSTTSGPIAKTSAVPVGSGTIVASAKMVVTQPQAGTFKGFSYVCTHQGCPVTKISGKDIECPCHGSKFSVEDGSVLEGPADKPLESIAVTVSGDSVVLG